MFSQQFQGQPQPDSSLIEPFSPKSVFPYLDALEKKNMAEGYLEGAIFAFIAFREALNQTTAVGDFKTLCQHFQTKYPSSEQQFNDEKYLLVVFEHCIKVYPVYKQDVLLPSFQENGILY
jgi:hypothetical protein